jgi:hypothetical protein
MSDGSDFLTIEQARERAETEAQRFMRVAFDQEEWPLLREECSTAPHCWIFYRRSELVIPADMPLLRCAFAVTKRGTLRIVADYSGDPKKAQEYAEFLSNFCLSRGE